VRQVDTGGLLLTIALGAALLALWCYVRWPGAAPSSLGGAILRALIAFGLLQVATFPLDAAAGASTGLAVLAVVGVIVPVLTFAFLASLWIMRFFADALKGFV
jgi:hypothetical protein